MARVAGYLKLKINGVLKQGKGEFEYNLGQPKRTPVLNADGSVAGYKEEPQAPWIKGKITDSSDFDVVELLNLIDATATLDLANGKTFILQEAFYSGEGTINTAEAEIEYEMTGTRAEELLP